MNQSQIYLPKLSPINKIIIIASGALFVLDFILSKTGGPSLGGMFGLSASSFFNGHIYNVMTYPFFSRSIIELILNCLMLWLMGSEFELSWGRKRYLSFIATSILGGGFLYLLIVGLFLTGSAVYYFPLAGLSGLVGSFCLAYAFIFPDRMFSFLMLIPVKAKYFCMILVVISLYQGIASPSGAGAWGQLGAILFAFLFMIVISNRNFRTLAQRMTQSVKEKSKPKSKAKLRIVKDDDENPPKYWQ